MYKTRASVEQKYSGGIDVVTVNLEKRKMNSGGHKAHVKWSSQLSRWERC